MGYLGLVPSESSTGDTVKRGGITKAANGAGETHSCGSGVELSISTARESRETAKGGGCAQTRARDCLESASQTVQALPVARAEGQAANRSRHGDCPRAIGLHLGDQSRDHGRSAGVTSPEAVDRSSRAALNRPTAPALQSGQPRQLTDEISSRRNKTRPVVTGEVGSRSRRLQAWVYQRSPRQSARGRLCAGHRRCVALLATGS